MSVTVMQGNCCDVAFKLPRNWFHCICTSPPYWLLRDYGTAPVRWPKVTYAPMLGLPDITVPAHSCELGQEPTLEMFVAHLVHCFRQLKPSLRSDGTLWVNLGDGYSSGGRSSYDETSKSKTGVTHRAAKGKRETPAWSKPKDRLGVPWRFAFAMQADGWYWRDEVIWSKKSPIPSSVKDRTTTSHEIVLVFSKEKHYFYDQHAIMEPVTGNAHPRGKGTTPKSDSSNKTAANRVKNNSDFAKHLTGLTLTRNPRSVWHLSSEPTKEKHYACWPTKLVAKMIKAGSSVYGCCSTCGAPIKKVLQRERVATRPGLKTKVPAGWDTRPGPHTSIDLHTHEGREANNAKAREATILDPDSPYQGHNGTICGNRDPLRHTTVVQEVGQEPSCECAVEIVPCRVLDPFGGMATTGITADRLHRDAVCIELSSEYADLATKKVKRVRSQELGMFAHLED